MRYLNEYLNSLSNQSCSDFDLVLLNDGVDAPALQDLLGSYNSLRVNVIDMPAGMGIPGIRKCGLDYAAGRYDCLVLTDCDDYFDRRRVEKTLYALQKYDFCYNNIIAVDEHGKRIGDAHFFDNTGNPVVADRFTDILDRNFCGFSNTGINLGRVDVSSLAIPGDVTAVDWWVFSLLVAGGCKGAYVEDTFTYYRQHGSNIVGAGGGLDIKKLRSGIEAKRMHYENLAKQLDQPYINMVKSRLDSINKFKYEMSSPEKMEEYINIMNGMDKNLLWWENIDYFKSMEET